MEDRNTAPRKLRVGWFSFTCCEDSSIILTELLNERFFDWKKLIDWRHARIFKSRNLLDDLDVAFVEGAIANDHQAAKLKQIRQVSKKLVAVGSCAVTGLPAGQRNLFGPETQNEIKPILTRFNYAEKVLKLSDVVPVDAVVPGCPMDPEIFLKLLNHLLTEFGVKAQEG